MGFAQDIGLLDDLDTAILDCAQTVEVTRFNAPEVIMGRVQPAGSTTFKTQLSVQPMTAKEMALLPEGMRNQGRVKAYGTVELKTVDTSTCRMPDRFEHNGITYQVDRVEDWTDAGEHYRFEAVRIDT